jgi:hypothetical protein
MPKVELDVETSASPEGVRAALLDFSDRRPEIWPSIDPTLYEVYKIGETFADVQEGSKLPGTRIWAREHYDWSAGELITWTVQESNFCAPRSYVSALIAPRGDGGSRIHVIWNRTPTSMAGRLAAVVIWLTRGKPIAASMRQALDKLDRPPAPDR